MGRREVVVSRSRPGATATPMTARDTLDENENYEERADLHKRTKSDCGMPTVSKHLSLNRVTFNISHYLPRQETEPWSILIPVN